MKARMLTVAAILAVAISQLHAGTITVTTTNDSGPGSLRDALASAADGDTIDASGISGTILLTNGELLVTNSVNIVGPGPAVLAVAEPRYPSPLTRLFHLGSNTVVDLSGLDITYGLLTNGVTYGAGIYVDHATLTISNCTVSGNYAYYGGGIYNDHGTLTVSACTVRYNFASIGGGIANYGAGGNASLEVTNSTVTGNSAQNNLAEGGGIYSDGSSGGNAILKVIDSAVDTNASRSGGGIYNYGDSGTASAIIVNSTINRNRGHSDSYWSGGGIYNGHGTLTISNCTVNGNFAAIGGGIDNDHGTLTISYCTVVSNLAIGEAGGINNNGAGGSASMEIINSVINSNSTDAEETAGGGILNNGYGGIASLRITGSILSGNLAYEGGAVYNYGENGTASVLIADSVLSGNSRWYSDAGGAVYNAIGTLQIFNSNISSNYVAIRGGGIYNGEPRQGGAAGITSAEIFNSVLSGNSAQYGNGVFNFGLYHGTAIVKIVNSTVSGNTGTNTNFGVDVYNLGPNYTRHGGVAVLQVANCTLSGTSETNPIPRCSIYNASTALSNAMLTVANTVLDTSTSGVSLTNNSGVITSLGYNLSSDDGGGFLTATGDQINTDPMLDPAGLQDNGGPTLTIALQCGSPAIDAGDPSFTPPPDFDQRGPGFPRVVGGRIDIGAFEVQQGICNRPPVAKCKNVTVSAGPNCTASASIDDGSYDPDAGDTITLSQSPAGPYGLGTTLVTLTVTDNHGASNSCTATVEVVDTTPPVPTVASLPVVSAQCSAILIAPTATDNCAGLISATTSDPTTYNSQGSFTVHWIYNDGNGNSVTQLQSVVIKDTVPPSITCPANVVVNAVSPSGVNVTFPAPIVSDNCSVASVTSSRASGSLFAIGTTTVTNQVVDEAGNASTCTFTVKVKNAREQIIDLITLVNGLPIRSDIKIALEVKLLTALLAIDINRKPIGCIELKDFIGLAAAQNGKKLTATQANLLIAEATRIRAVLGC